jgi:hydrogenase/urease accessory protein HupE
MKRLAMLAGCFPAVAWAHPGHHLFDSIAGYVAHLLSEPDHVAMIAGAGLGLGWLVTTALRRRRKRSQAVRTQ